MSKFCIPVRFLVCFSTWFCLVVFYFHRTNMSVAILSMTHIYNQTEINHSSDNNSSLPDTVPPVRPNANDYPHKNESAGTKAKEDLPIYKSWTPKMQDIILSVYFFGYASTHFIGSIISSKIGTRWMMLICLGGSTICSFLIVPLAGISPYALIADRVIGGAFAGSLYPMIHEIIGTWVHKDERTLLAALTHSGNVFGIAGTYAIGGLLANEKFGDMGWIYFLYLTGGLGVIAIIFWTFLGFSNPQTHPYISENEKNYLIGDRKIYKTKKIPYRSIFKSVYVWVAALAHFSAMFIFYAMLIGHAKFLKNTFDITITKASYFSMIPFITYFLINMVYPPIIDYLRIKKGINISKLRKITSLISIFGAASLVSSVGFLNEDKLYYVIAIMTVGMGFLGMSVSGYFTSIIDLSPTYAGVIMGVMNTIGSLAGFLQPLIATQFINKYEKPFGWRYTFIMTASVAVFTSLFFIIFGSSELQAWGDPEDSQPYTKLESIDLDYTLSEKA